MVDQSSKTKELVSIKIDRTLYSQLRKHCDLGGIRFKDFVEDSLENAIHIDESIKMHNLEIEKLKRKATSYDYAFRRGFAKGLYFLFLASQGKVNNNLDADECDILRDKKYVASKGTQIALFEEQK